MSDEPDQHEAPHSAEESQSSPEPEQEGPPPTPFDHPLFLPVLLGAGAVWFGYDGWFNPEIKAVMFNRIGFALLLLGAGYTGYQAKKELKVERDARSRSDS